MRILYFTRDYTTHDYRFLTSLAGSGLEVVSLRLEKKDFRFEARLLPGNIRQVDWAGGRAPLTPGALPDLLPHFKRVIAEVRPHLVHAGPIPSSAYLTTLAGFHPLVSMSWGSDLLYEIDRDPAAAAAAKTALDGTSVMVCDCQAVQRRAETLGFPAERVVIFPWGVDLEDFRPGGGNELRHKLGWDDDHFIILSTRSWEPVYGVDVTVKAFALAARRRPEIRLLLLGGGSQDKLIRGLIAENNMEGRVHFAGQVGQAALPAYYRAADLYVSSSHSDGSSVSLMEALACGRAALVSDIAGNAEWVEDGITGWLFRDGDERGLAEKLEQISGQRNDLDAIGQAARALAEARADWNANFQKLLSAYQMAVNL